MTTSYLVWLEDINWNHETVVCGECGHNRFSIVDGNGLPWRLQVRCTQCAHTQVNRSNDPSTWIKFMELD